MPNYIKNRIELIGTDEDIAKLKERFSTHIKAHQKTALSGELTFTDGNDNYGWLNEETNTFIRREQKDVIGVPEGWTPFMHEAWTRFPDFNKITPMPDELNITSGSSGDMGLSVINGESENIFMDMREQLKRFYEMDSKRRIEVMEAGIAYAKNIEKYGFKTWYDWSIENWGTKWNASDCESENKSFEFTTAWSGVPDLIEKMHLEFPTVKILYEFSDEDTGCNCGIGIFENGTSNFRKLENSSIEAYELAFKLRPESKEYYALVDGKYEYVDEDE